MHTKRSPIHDPGGLGVFELMATAMMYPDWPNARVPDPEKPDRPGSESRNASPKTAEGAPRRSLLERLERWVWANQQRDLEAYLAQASDIHDLEARIRMIERRGLHAHS